MQFVDLAAQYEVIGSDIEAGIARVLAHQHFIQGPEVATLEAELAAFSGAQHAITCANGTDALQIALMALEIGAGDAVFVPSFTYTATAETILLVGATPVFVDVSPQTYNVDFDSVEEAITVTRRAGRLRPAALMTVDLYGKPVDYKRAGEIAKRNDLKLVSDGAQAFGARSKGGRVGSLADITTTSFFPAKPLGCYGDGGAIFTNDLDLALRARSICLHGKGAAKYDVVRVGVNSRLDTLQAAILLAKLTIFEDELARRHAVASAYVERLSGKVTTPLLPEEEDLDAWAQFTVQVEDRTRVQEHMRARGIPTAVYYPRPMHLQPAYAAFGEGPGSLVASEQMAQVVLSLPMHPYITSADINEICDAMLELEMSVAT